LVPPQASQVVQLEQQASVQAQALLVLVEE
jgi:hypothetical protein